jgi:replicative DNA helicase
MSTDLIVLHRVLTTGDTSILTRSGLDEENAFPEQVEAYRFIRRHVDQFAETPSIDTVVAESVRQRWPSPFEPMDSTETTETITAKHHDRLVKLRQRRVLEEAAKRFGASSGFDMQRYVEGEFAQIRMSINARTGAGVVNWSKSTSERAAAYEQRASGIDDSRVPLLWSEIEDAIGGFHRGDYVDVEGPTKGGKSWIGDVIGLTANRAGYRVYAAKAESYKREALSRLDTIEFGISNRGIFAGSLDENAVKTYLRKLSELGASNRPDFIVKTPEDWPHGLTIEQIESDIDQFDPDVVIIDQFNLMRHRVGGDHQAKADTSRALKLMFARKGVVGVVLTQANGDYLKRREKSDESDDNTIRELRPPKLSDYSETIAIRQDCTHMIALDSVQWIDETTKTKMGKALIVVEISRTGGAGLELPLMWFPNEGMIRPRAATDLF